MAHLAMRHPIVLLEQVDDRADQRYDLHKDTQKGVGLVGAPTPIRLTFALWAVARLAIFLGQSAPPFDHLVTR
ncbi:hypothetical protein [Saccharothrix saharensis]|uniref:hypothetical protein n=1 Tax=Saccharothrix saharensis TaxID=571190 RepID=UPI0011511787|nr:hypothetical protein [Saccharothrix saharensis]